MTTQSTCVSKSKKENKSDILKVKDLKQTLDIVRVDQ